MPYRKVPLVTQEIYHVFNRSIARQPIFLNLYDYRRAYELINFYRFEKPPMRFSHYNRLEKEIRLKFIENLCNVQRELVTILAYCLMPNHLHFLLKQKVEDGISTFMRNFQNSYAKYFNTKNERSGSLLQAMFKAVRIETDEQLTHVSRYIHLNPVTAFIIDITSLENYEWLSFRDYISDEKKDDFVDSSFILNSYFESSQEKYKEFVYDQANYQQKLYLIEHLLLE